MFNHGALATREDWTGRFREIRHPVLVLHGDKDPILPIENGRAIADGIRGALLVEFSGVGHELPAAEIPTIAQKIAAHTQAAPG